VGISKKDMRSRILIALALATSVASCGDECREYSEFTCKQIEVAEYNVVFRPWNEDVAVVGRASGLSHCARVALNYADWLAEQFKDGKYDGADWQFSKDKQQKISQKISRGEWAYACCMIAKGSDCYEKHR
jgi:hypothetical protein